MVKVIICGGLGNQLFQYAFARKIANDYEVYVEIHHSKSADLNWVDLPLFRLLNQDVSSQN